MSDETKQAVVEPKPEMGLSARVDAIESKLSQYGMGSEAGQPNQQSSRRSMLKRQIDD